jgi:hypothetical protein
LIGTAAASTVVGSRSLSACKQERIPNTRIDKTTAIKIAASVASI